jgi:hypothetical protein
MKLLKAMGYEEKDSHFNEDNDYQILACKEFPQQTDILTKESIVYCKKHLYYTTT